MGRREGGLWMLLAGSFLAAGGYALEPSRGPQGTTGPEMVLTAPTIANSDSNHRMIAVTGIDVTGNNILYVIDTINPHIAVYQANGGSAGTQSISLVAARDISLDLQLSGLNDRSEFDYNELRERFIKDGLLDE
ncbi:MAG: hypothetical protein ACI9F9_002264 [Candidatus Paceibacteria bacterium]|jgi:hypothetical protein